MQINYKMENQEDKVYQVIQQLEDNFGMLDEISKTAIQHIPLHILQTKVKTESLRRNWHKIPIEKRAVLEDYLPCDRHYNQLDQDDRIDGFPPAKIKCWFCILTY